jgi:hypothetical protein
MNYDGFADAGGRIERSSTDLGGRIPASGSAGPSVTSALRWLARGALALLAVWLVVYGIPAFGGVLAATVVGFVGLWAVPWLVVSGVVRAIEAVE